MEKITPLFDQVIVRLTEAEEQTVGGIALPDTARKKPQRGKVIAVGPGHLLPHGTRAQLQVEVGDVVIFESYAGTPVTLNDENCLILRESSILACHLPGKPTTPWRPKPSKKKKP